MAFKPAVPLADLPAGTARTVELDGRLIAVYNVDGRVYATSNTCQHMGGPVGEGRLDGTTIACPWHGHTYDVTTGSGISNPGWCLDVLEVRLNGGQVHVNVPDEPAVWRKG